MMYYSLSRPLDTAWKHFQNLMLPSRAEISNFPLSEVMIMSLLHPSALLAERIVIMEDHSSQSVYLFRDIYKPKKLWTQESVKL